MKKKKNRNMNKIKKKKYESKICLTGQFSNDWTIKLNLIVVIQR